MGAFITNLHVRTDDRKRLIGALRLANALPACVSPAFNGWTSAFPAATESQEQEVLVRVTRQVAAHVKVPTISFLVHDSDIFRYVFAHGRLRDEYNSEPGYWGDGDEPPAGGNVNLLLKCCGAAASVRKLADLLKRKRVGGKPAGSAEELMYELGKLLGINGDLLANSYAYLKGRSLPHSLRRVAR